MGFPLRRRLPSHSAGLGDSDAQTAGASPSEKRRLRLGNAAEERPLPTPPGTLAEVGLREAALKDAE